MGTRGTYGIRKNKEDKLTYNHFDSYPSGLGEKIVEFIKKYSVEELNTLFDRLIIVNEDDKVSKYIDTKEKYKEIIPFLERNKDFFSYTSDKANFNIKMDMYSFLRHFQGDLEKYIENPEVNFLTSSEGFIKDSLMCEWGYIINLDTNALEVWKGFQSTPSPKNRYGTKKDGEYYPCKMIEEISFEDIRNIEFSLEKVIPSSSY